MTHFDLAIIGTGSGNMVLNRRFADRRVAIIERKTFGGTCLNVGCIPTKMFVVPADRARQAGDGARLGLSTSYDGVDWAAVRDRIFGRIDPIGADAEAYRRSLPNVTVFKDTARFTAPRTLRIGDETVTADQIVVATGSRATVPEIPGLDQLEVHTSDTIMRLDALPERLVIIGGGYVACEFGHVFFALGTQVTQVHRGPWLLRGHDEEIAQRFTDLAEWDVRLNATVTSAEPGRLHLSDGTTLETDLVLVATGRTANTDDLGLQRAGVRVNGGRIITDAHLRTTAEGVWALGDVCAHEQLKHVANADARVVQHNLLYPDDLREASYRAVPHAVFTDPQVAAVGVTEAQARADLHRVEVAVQRYADVAYGWAMEDTEHIVKLVAGDGELVGAHILGPQASILIQPLIQALALRLPVQGLARSQYWIHPALSEVVENALLKLEAQLL